MTLYNYLNSHRFTENDITEIGNALIEHRAPNLGSWKIKGWYAIDLVQQFNKPATSTPSVPAAKKVNPIIEEILTIAPSNLHKTYSNNKLKELCTMEELEALPNQYKQAIEERVDMWKATSNFKAREKGEVIPLLI